MKSILTKLAYSILIILLICIFSSNNIYALDKVISDGDSFLAAGDSEESVIDEEALRDTSNKIYNILVTIALVLAVAIGMILGIKFMVGSVDEQAKIKESIIPYVVGVIVVFGAFTIWKIAVELGNGFLGG